jgi:uncharacterized protein (DUF58 family)
MTFKGWPIMLVTLLVLFLQLSAPAQIWTMLFIGLGLTQVVAYFWARSLQENFSLTRERRYAMAQVGDRFEERFTIAQRGTFPALWVEIIDHSSLPDYSASQVTGLGTQGKLRWHTEYICARRGVFQLGPTEVNLGDPFGLFAVRQFYPHTVDFTITPPIMPLPDIHIASRGHSGEGVPRPYSLAPTEPTATVRVYNPADSLKRIHWPTTARRESLYVRGLQETTSGDWWLVLDVEAGVHNGLDPDSTLEKAVILAASLADKGVAGQQAVGLLAHGQEAVWLPPKAIALQRWQILTTLAKIQEGNLSLDQLLSRNSQTIKHDTSLIIITTSTDTAWLNPLLLLKRQGVVPTVILIYTEETYAALASLQQALAAQVIHTYLLDQVSIHHPTPEELSGHWEWRVLGTGRLVALRKPEGDWEAV